MSRLYLECAGIVDKIRYKKMGIKDAVYGNKASDKQKPAILGLVSKTMLSEKALLAALNSIGAFKAETKMRHSVMLVMAAELIFGSGKIQGGGHVKRFLMERLDQMKEFMAKEGTLTVIVPDSAPAIPRYIRVNASRWKGINAAVTFLKSNGVSTVEVDPSVPNLLVIANTETKNLVTLECFKKGSLLMQDKSTCVSAHALLANRPSGPIHVIDACAAPGGKTLHILEMLRSGDCLTAIELDEKRAKTLEERLAALGDINKGVKVQVLNCDFLTLFSEDARLATPVTHINLDPSCSGSGMAGPVTRGEERLKSLASFQAKMLKHALSAFSSTKVICYSTCSVNAVENEEVVDSTLVSTPNFSVDSKPLPAWWKTTSDDGFVRTTLESDNCRGFFLAKLVRNTK